MRASLVLTLLILVVGSWFGVKDALVLIELRQERDRLVEEAEKLGLAVDLTHADLGMARLGERELREEKAKVLAEKLIRFALAMKAAEAAGSDGSEEQQEKIYELIGDLLELDPGQLKGLIAELKASPELDDEMRGQIIGFSVMMLANDHPEAALALFTETEDLREVGQMKDHLIRSSLTRWATEDPLAAMEWIRENEEKHADLVSEEAKQAVIAGAAKQDPRLAFQLMDELGLEDSGSAIGSMAGGLAGSGEMTAFLEAARSHAEASGNRQVIRMSLMAMAGKWSRGGFEDAKKWLAGAELADDELVDFANGLAAWQVKGDTGSWIDWMSEEVDVGQVAGQIGGLMQQWTSQDFRAAGEWLNDAEEGPAKVLAVKAYAETVAPYEPESAALWAATLPEGEARTSLVRRIYDEWKGKDVEAAEVFAADWGIAEKGEDDGAGGEGAE